MNTSCKAALAIIAAFFGLMVAAVPAGAASSTSAATGIVNVQGAKHVVSASLAHKINSGEWRGLRTADLAKAGIHPNMALPNGTKIQASTGGAHTDSASGCSGRVCIYVFGTGLHVDDWDTSATNSSYLCTYAGYWVAGVLTGTSNVVCGSGDFWAYWTPARYYINGTRLCNTWLNLSGKPCETVHS